MTGRPLGGLVADQYLEKDQDKQRTKETEARGHNWELLRQRAEEAGLYLQPLDSSAPSASRAILWVAEADLEDGAARHFDGQFLNISNPFADPRLRHWSGYSETLESRRARRAGIRRRFRDAHPVRMIPLAMYGLDHPHTPLLLVDFRGSGHPSAPRDRAENRRRRQLPAFSSFTGFGHLGFLAAKSSLMFIHARHGGATDRSARRRAFVFVRHAIGSTRTSTRSCARNCSRRIEKIDVNPIERPWDQEIRDGWQQYDALIAYARSTGLAREIDRTGATKCVRRSHGPAHGRCFMWLRSPRWACIGIRITIDQSQVAKLDQQRRDARLKLPAQSLSPPGQVGSPAASEADADSAPGSKPGPASDSRPGGSAAASSTSHRDPLALQRGVLQGQAKRLVLVKVDGLPADRIERLMEQNDPQTGRSVLPWMQYIFLERGAWARNFYVRGISLSAPSWSMLDTGQHLTIRGNAEFDRFIPRVYDYLNFFPFYRGYAELQRVDMPGVEVLDQFGIPLLLDQFPPEARYESMQLFQRGVRWTTLKNSAAKSVIRPVRELINEWETGFEMSPGIEKEQEKEIISALADPEILYLDFYLGDYDHSAHLTNDDSSQLVVIKRLDALLGRLWNAIQASPLAGETVLALVSDHGMNSKAGTYSQSYNLVKLFNSAEGGAHHVVTVRYPLTEYKLRGLDPFVSWVVNPSAESSYLRNQNDYPTALLDPDGNERASMQLRNSDLNAHPYPADAMETQRPHFGPTKSRSGRRLADHRSESSRVVEDLGAAQ